MSSIWTGANYRGGHSKHNLNIVFGEQWLDWFGWTECLLYWEDEDDGSGLNSGLWMSDIESWYLSLGAIDVNLWRDASDNMGALPNTDWSEEVRKIQVAYLTLN